MSVLLVPTYDSISMQSLDNLSLGEFQIPTYEMLIYVEIMTPSTQTVRITVKRRVVLGFAALILSLLRGKEVPHHNSGEFPM